jgi:hypothetical protein
MNDENTTKNGLDDEYANGKAMLQLPCHVSKQQYSNLSTTRITALGCRNERPG